MALINTTPETSAFPTVEVSSEVFQSHPEAVFWIGRLATNAGKGILHSNDSYVDALGRFRANVYVHERGYLDASVLDENGREFDEYDNKSVQFAVIENEHEGVLAPRIVGSIRMIQKENESDLYPIEKYFPEVFEEPIGKNSAEVSRFIASYPEDRRFMQHVIALSLIRAATLFSAKENIEDCYCIIEKPLYKSLAGIGIPVEILGNPKNIPEQGGVLYPIRIKIKDVLDSVTTDKTGNIILKDFFIQEIGSGGEGYYPADLIGGAYE